MNWQELHTVTFALPWALWLLLAIPLLLLLHGQRGGAPAVVYSSVAPLLRTSTPRKSRAGWFTASLLAAAMALFCIALARPQLANIVSHTEASGVDIMLALDVSKSMLAEDISIGVERANRLEAVKKVTEDFINGRANDRIGMVAFAGRPYLVSPLTLDHDWLLKNLERVQIGQVEDGTAIGLALASSANRLKERSDAKSRIVVLLTDGDNNAGKVDPITAAEAAHTLGIKIYTVGVGSRGIARIPLKDPLGRTVYQNIAVQVDEATLQKIAAIGEGSFFRATDAQSLQQIFEKIDALEKSTIEVSQTKHYRDLFPWLLAAGVVLLGLAVFGEHILWRRVP